MAPALAAFVAGVGDEAFQWFLPARVGELADVALNAVAIGCGLLVGSAITPPASRKTTSGTLCAASTMPSADADPSTSSTANASATEAIELPRVFTNREAK